MTGDQRHRPGIEPNSIVRSTICQDEQMSRPGSRILSDAKLNRGAEDRGRQDSRNSEPNCVAGDWLGTDQAEQMCSLRNVPESRDTQTVTLCPTRTGPVARLVDLPVINISLPILTPDFDQGQAEQMFRAEQ